MKLIAAIAAGLLLAGCTTRPLVGSLVVCIAADCDIHIKPEATQSAAEKIGGGLAQFVAEKYRGN